MKIDVEGHEAAVLAGLESTFRDQPPYAVVFESNAWFDGLGQGKVSTDFPFADLPTIRFFAEHHYRFYAVSRSLLKVRPRRDRQPDERADPPVSDLLAIHESKVDGTRALLRIVAARP